MSPGRRVGLLLLLGCGLALAQGHSPAPDPHSTPFSLQLLAAINAERARLALSALAPAPALAAIASAHSRDMAARRQLSHAGFAGRFAHADRQACVENLASGPIRPEALVQAWRESPAHRLNLVEPGLRLAGIAAIDGYVTFFACE